MTKCPVFVLFILVTFFTFSSLSLPLLSYKTGNLFFGYSSHIYNVDIAQFFFRRAVSPTVSLLGSAPSFAHYQLSRTYFIQGNFSNAITHANKELELYPTNCRTHYIRGLTYGYMNDLDNAIKDFETFNTTCVRDSWAGHNDLAWFYFRKGDMGKMLTTIEPMVIPYETNPWVQNSYGIALLNTRNYKKAMIAFDKALDAAEQMTGEDWGIAYPGNDPRIYDKGLAAMRETIRKNKEVTRGELRNNINSKI